MEIIYYLIMVLEYDNTPDMLPSTSRNIVEQVPDAVYNQVLGYDKEDEGMDKKKWIKKNDLKGQK
jgi:hypothetical protein